MKKKRKIDRVLLNHCWDADACRTTFLPISTQSDHAPYVVSMAQEIDDRPRPFRFENMLLLHPNCRQIVDDFWTPYYDGYKQYSVCRRLLNLKTPLKELGKRNFNHISEKAKRADKEYSDALRVIDVTHVTDDEIKELQRLKNKLFCTLGLNLPFFLKREKLITSVWLTRALATFTRWWVRERVEKY